MKRRRNPRSIPPWVIQLALYGGGAYLLYKFGAGVLDKFNKGSKALTKPLAEAIVNSRPAVTVGDVTYQLPSGARISNKLTIPAGGPYFTYMDIRYKLTAASPPGSGNYLAVKA